MSLGAASICWPCSCATSEQPTARIATLTTAVSTEILKPADIRNSNQALQLAIPVKQLILAVPSYVCQILTAQVEQ